jgi:hypothetical protein
MADKARWMRNRIAPVVLFFFGAARASWDVLSCEPPLAGATPAIPTAEAAIAQAKYAWGISSYPASAQDIARFEPYHAELEGAQWHVYGSPKGGKGIPEALVCQKNGSTELWHWQR